MGYFPVWVIELKIIVDGPAISGANSFFNLDGISPGTDEDLKPLFLNFSNVWNSSITGADLVISG